MNGNVKKILRPVYYKLFLPGRRFLKFFWRCWIRNIPAFVMKKVRIGRCFDANQRVYFTGAGQVEIGEGVFLGYRLGGYYRGGCWEIQARDKKARVVLKEGISANNNGLICCNDYVEIGRDCLIGQHVQFLDFDAHGILPEERRTSNGKTASIIVGDNVWIGSDCTLLQGTVLGENCVVAAGAVVKGVFPANTILGGVPAKVLSTIEDGKSKDEDLSGENLL